MPTRSMQELQNTGVHIPAPLVTSNWARPVEAITPHPKHTDPLCVTTHDSVTDTLPTAASELSPGDVLLAHETDQESAETILESGFEVEETGSAPIREHAVFGWVHETDIGYFKQENWTEAEAIVLYAVPREHVFLSSYETSARQLLNGVIDQQEYEEKHVLVYNDYESLHWERDAAIEHLGYEPESILPSR